MISEEIVWKHNIKKLFNESLNISSNRKRRKGKQEDCKSPYIPIG